MYFDVSTLQKYFVQRWNQEAEYTVEQLRELMGELNGLLEIREETDVFILNSFKSNRTPLKGQETLSFFNMVPIMSKMPETPEEKTKVLTGPQFDELCTASGMREVQAFQIHLPDGASTRFYDFNAGNTGVKVDPSIFAQVTPEQQHAALTRFVTANMRIIGHFAALQSKMYGAGAVFLFTKSAFDDLIEINPAFDWTGAGPDGWKGEGEQPANSGCRLDRQYLLAWGLDDSVRDEDMQVGQFTAEELSVDMRQFTKSLKKSIDEGEPSIAFPLVICADPTSEGTPEQLRHLIMPNASGLYPADAKPGETCAVVIQAVPYPIDKDTKRKRVEHAVAVAKAKADGTEAPASLLQLSDREQFIETIKAHGKPLEMTQHYLSYFMDRPC